MIKYPKAFWLILLPVVFMGCTFHPNRGFYEGKQAIGWIHGIEVGTGGLNDYRPAVKPPFLLIVSFSTTERGQLYMNITCDVDEPRFSESKIVVTFEDGTTQDVEARRSAAINIGMVEALRVRVPSFTVRGYTAPTLEASFKWNVETRYYVRGLQ